MKLEAGAFCSITCKATGSTEIDPAQASTAAIIANELITNALKHCKERIVVTCGPSGGEFLLLVQDDGPGLPDGFSPRSTTRFGLITAMRLCAMLKGVMTWSSAPGEGAVFQIKIPLAELA